MWKKIENFNGLPIYMNEVTKEQQWDHPEFTKIRASLNECNYVKYSSYRVAMKFRTLQKGLSMHPNVPLSLICGVFERHKLGVNENTLNLDCYDLEAILFDVFFACKKQHEHSLHNFNTDLATELMLNLLLNVYDSEKTGKIQVLSVKLLLGILSNSNSIENLHKFLFELCADHNNCVTRLKLQNLLKKLSEIINFLHEDASFGQHLINSSVDTCFVSSPGLVGVTENAFMSWLDTNPPILTWLPTLHRLNTSENNMHRDETCRTCHIKSFYGLMYKCLKCKNYTQCQQCFFSGKTCEPHKLSHSLREFCQVQPAKEHENGSLRHSMFFKKLCNMLGCNRVEKPDKTLLRFEQHDETIDSTLTCPLTQLQGIINEMERQNNELNNVSNSNKINVNQMKIYLKNHRVEITKQIVRLKVLKEYLNQPVTVNEPSRIVQEINENIPVNIERSEATRNTDLDDALAKLQQILANNFTLNETLCQNQTNSMLK